ncbi:MAG: hypothetical protein IPM04_12510 [Saprospiraceae bacterium]|nr:hypothetical protein [Candidatus Brachybacter algidus]MBK8748647.1 hypothetical protein [Candidatus Brachybacter algidus]
MRQSNIAFINGWRVTIFFKPLYGLVDFVKMRISVSGMSDNAYAEQRTA